MEGILSPQSQHAIEQAADVGCDGIELVIDGPDPTDDTIWTARGRHRLRQLVYEDSMEVPSICLGYLNDGSLTEDDVSVRVAAHHSIPTPSRQRWCLA